MRICDLSILWRSALGRTFDLVDVARHAAGDDNRQQGKPGFTIRANDRAPPH
jgi:hypothetical protein